jgi:hypothetical protein
VLLAARHPATRRSGVLILLMALVFGGLVTVPSRATALPLIAGPRILMLGDSITWQVCTDKLMQYPPEAPQYLRERDGGCYGFSGATTADMAFMTQSGRFYSTDPGQPHPKFDYRGQTDEWSMREAINRADIIVMALGTNDSGRGGGTLCNTTPYTPWPVQIAPNPTIGVSPPPCAVPIDAFRANIDYFVWLANNKPVFWFDIGITNPGDPAYAHQQDYNDAIWGAAGRYPNVHPIAWSRAVAAHPKWLRSDGVHLNTPAGGNAGRYQLLMDSLRGCGYH